MSKPQVGMAQPALLPNVNTSNFCNAFPFLRKIQAHNFNNYKHQLKDLCHAQETFSLVRSAFIFKILNVARFFNQFHYEILIRNFFLSAGLNANPMVSIAPLAQINVTSSITGPVSSIGKH